MQHHIATKLNPQRTRREGLLQGNGGQTALDDSKQRVFISGLRKIAKGSCVDAEEVCDWAAE
jgi:hypothetical protein